MSEIPLELSKNIELVTLNDIGDADILIFLVAHSVFKKVNWTIYSDKCLIDACGLLETVKKN